MHALTAPGRYYFSSRITFLELSIFFLSMWLIFGFDSGVAGSFYGEPLGMGIHWSTLLKMTLTVYLLMINFHVNGLRSFNDLKTEFKRDLKYLFRWSNKTRIKGRTEYYQTKSLMGSLRALFLSVCVSLMALFAFEIPWTLFYNWYQFGDMWFPLYYFTGPMFGLSRNFIFLFAALYCYILAVYLIPPNTLKRSYKIIKNFASKQRNYEYILKLLSSKNKYQIKHKIIPGALFLLLGFASFLVWINTPQSPDLIMHYDQGTQFNRSHNDLIFPERNLFPQTIYTYYNVANLENYSVDNIGSYWVQDDYIHFLNLLTKTLFFIGVDLIFLVNVKPKHIKK